PSVESLGLLTATIDEQIERIFLMLPEDEAVEPIAGRGEEVREQLRLLTHLKTTGKTIRTHGDFHLGQTLWARDDWVVIDFEGEMAVYELRYELDNRPGWVQIPVAGIQRLIEEAAPA